MTTDMTKYGELTPTDMTTFDAVTKAGDWLPRIDLVDFNSKHCKEGGLKAGSYVLVTSKDNVTVLGPEVVMFAFAFRPKAMRFVGEEVKSFHDLESAEFKQIKADSEVPNSNCKWGPEVLVYIPSLKKYATIFFGNATGRRETGKLKGKMPGLFTFKAQSIKRGKFTWIGPVLSVCSAPAELPPVIELKEQIEKHFIAKAEAVEPANSRER